MTRTIERIGIALVAILLVVGILWLRSCEREGAADAKAKLATGQAGAAIESGHDAATTIGNRMDADASIDTITRENANAIRDASGADAPVAVPVRDAGLASLCRRAAYQRDPRCLQLADPR